MGLRDFLHVAATGHHRNIRWGEPGSFYNADGTPRSANEIETSPEPEPKNETGIPFLDGNDAIIYDDFAAERGDNPFGMGHNLSGCDIEFE